jgi:hypothetical protein
MEIAITFSPPLEEQAAKYQALAQSGLADLIEQTGDQIDDMVLAAIIAEAPRKTEAFADAIRSEKSSIGANGVRYEYKAPDPLATYIIEGTAPHPIDPVNSTVLRFLAASGDVVFARHVEHPGTSPNNFVSRAWDSIAAEVIDVWSRIGLSIAEQVT